MSGRLDGKVTLITGAAAGLGRVAAELFAAEGGRVVIADVTDGADAVDAIAAAGGEAAYVATDVRDDASVAAAVAFAVEHVRRAARALQQRRHLPGRRRRPDQHLRRDVGDRPRHQRHRRRPVLPPRHPGDARLGRRQHRQRRLVRRPPRRGDAADRLHRVEGRGAVDDPRDRRRSTPARASVPTRCAPGRCSRRCSPSSCPTTPSASAASCTSRWAASVSRSRSPTARCSSPVRRVVVHDRAVAAHRRRHHRRVHDPGVTRGDQLARPPRPARADIEHRRDRHRARRVRRSPRPARRQARPTAEFFFDVVLADGTENCDYLLACDLDNTPIPGFRWASYDQGYGDMRGVVDPSTIRYLPWLENDGAGARRSRRRRLRRAGRGVAAADAAAPGGRGGRRRLRGDVRQRDRVLPVQGELRRRQRRRLPRR